MIGIGFEMCNFDHFCILVRVPSSVYPEYITESRFWWYASLLWEVWHFVPGSPAMIHRYPQQYESRQTQHSSNHIIGPVTPDLLRFVDLFPANPFKLQSWKAVTYSPSAAFSGCLKAGIYQVVSLASLVACGQSRAKGDVGGLFGTTVLDLGLVYSLTTNKRLLVGKTAWKEHSIIFGWFQAILGVTDPFPIACILPGFQVSSPQHVQPIFCRLGTRQATPGPVTRDESLEQEIVGEHRKYASKIVGGLSMGSGRPKSSKAMPSYSPPSWSVSSLVVSVWGVASTPNRWSPTGTPPRRGRWPTSSSRAEIRHRWGLGRPL